MLRICACVGRASLNPPLQPLQVQLLQTAALQIQSASLPVAAHALGLVPESLAAAHTTLPLCTSRNHAIAYCAAFVGANLVAVLGVCFQRVHLPSRPDDSETSF